MVGAEDTDPDVLDWAMGFYTAIGKRPIRLKKEIEAYVANRLQRAIFAEALSLVGQGICGFDDIDDGVTWGPGSDGPFRDLPSPGISAGGRGAFGSSSRTSAGAAARQG